MVGESKVSLSQKAIFSSALILHRLQDIANIAGLKLYVYTSHLIRLLVQNVDKLSLAEIQSVLQSTLVTDRQKEIQAESIAALIQLSAQCKTLVVSNIQELQEAETCELENVTIVDPVYLLLDGEISRLPWESVPKLSNQQFYRIPCVLHARQRSESYLNAPLSVDMAQTIAIVNPSGDLNHTSDALAPILSKNKEWLITIGTRSHHDMTKMLTSRDLFLYFGHGSGREYLPEDSSLLSSPWRAMMVLMGCSSGALQSDGDLEFDGDVLSYLISGAPTILANLWDVTDKDIDRFSVSLLESWMKDCAKQAHRFVTSAFDARNSCRLRWLTGSAPVFYGTPIILTDSRINPTSR